MRSRRCLINETRYCTALRSETRSPGADRQRIVKTNRWVMSVIAGSVRDGLGILNNEIYIGRVIWNRFKWVRSAADSSRRRRVQNPRSEWVIRMDERPRIIPQRLWERVHASANRPRRSATA